LRAKWNIEMAAAAVVNCNKTNEHLEMVASRRKSKGLGGKKSGPLG
jgi:hypothetical protein